MQKWFQIKIASEYAGCSVRTFRKWLKSGLKHSKVGGLILVKADDIDAFIERFSYTAKDENEVSCIVNEVLRDIQ